MNGRKALQCPPQFLWVFQTCEENCRAFYVEKDLGKIVSALYEEDWNCASKDAFKVLCGPEIYCELCSFIFDVPRKCNAISVLQSHGYFVRGDRTLFSCRTFSVESYLSLVECLMWAYLDRKIPRSSMIKVLGKSSGSLPDSEHCICAWINTVVSKHAHLPAVNVISQQFFGQPYLRVILFHFTLKDVFMNISDTSENNMSIGFSGAKELDIPLPFDETQLFQPPLSILCFWCKAIEVLSCLPVAKPQLVLSDEAVARRLTGVREMRRVVGEAKKRCQELVTEVSIKCEEARRCRSVMRRVGKVLASDSNKRIEEDTDCVEGSESRRVRWDRSVMILAKKAYDRKASTFASSLSD
jgi:hypothetical protein